MCSGIEAASAAWKPLGWRCAFVSEIEPFPRAVLSHHYPDVPLHGDFTTIKAGDYEPIDLLVGGTPCQDFSVAGLRAGIAGERGNLTLEFLCLADRLRPQWLVWENVPGILSSDGGRALGAFLGGLAELGYGFAYRILDAQYFGVPQRRRRVFVVANLGDWRPAAAVLFERESLSGNPAPRREAGEGVAHSTAPSLTASDRGVGRTGESRGQDPVVVAPTLNAAFGKKLGLDNQHIDGGAGLFITHTLRGDGFDASEDGTGRGTPLVPVAFNITPSNSNKDYNARESQRSQAITTGGNRPSARGGDLITQPAIAFSSKDHGADAGAISPTLRAMGHSGSHANAGGQVAVAFQSKASASNSMNPSSVCPAIDVGKSDGIAAHIGSAVRRLTPKECCRLQGFPDDYLDITYRGKPAADGPKYKALGNSMAVPVMRWIGERIQLIADLK